MITHSTKTKNMKTYKITIRTIYSVLDNALGRQNYQTTYTVQATSRKQAEKAAEKAHKQRQETDGELVGSNADLEDKLEGLLA